MYKILHQGNGVVRCKSRGSHKWPRGGKQLGLNNNALSWVNAIFCYTQEIRVFTRCRTVCEVIKKNESEVANNMTGSRSFISFKYMYNVNLNVETGYLLLMLYLYNKHLIYYINSIISIYWNIGLFEVEKYFWSRDIL